MTDVTQELQDSQERPLEALAQKLDELHVPPPVPIPAPGVYETTPFQEVANLIGTVSYDAPSSFFKVDPDATITMESIEIPSIKAGSIPLETGLRYNEGKLRYDLLPPDAIEALVEVLTMGAKKYADRNWEKGFAWMSCYASLMRHLQQWAKGKDRDAESGQLHMAHVMWNAMALTTFALRVTGVDDRVKLSS